MLDFHHEAGLGGERGLERHDLVAMRDLLPRVAAVERLGPDQAGVVERLPAYLPRAGRHALAGDVVGDRQVGDRGDGLAGRVPDLGLAREVGVGHAIRERAADRFDEQVLFVGRRVGAGDESGRTDSLDLTGLGVDPGDLAGREMLEEVFVVRSW